MTDSRLPNLTSNFRDFFGFKNLSPRRSRELVGFLGGKSRESEKLGSRSRESESELSQPTPKPCQKMYRKYPLLTFLIKSPIMIKIYIN